MKMKDVLRGMSTPKLIATLFESLRDRNVAESREFIKEATVELSKRPPIQGPKGDKGDPGVGAPLINNLETGGTEAALTAQMGKEIYRHITDIDTRSHILLQPTSNDNSDMINRAIIDCHKNSKYKKIVLDGEFYVTAKEAYKPVISLLSNITIEFTLNSKIILNPCSFSGYQIVEAKNIENFKLINPHIVGDKDNHIGNTGQWGHGIYINGCRDFKLEGNIKIEKTWGDGIAFVKTEDSFFR